MATAEEPEEPTETAAPMSGLAPRIDKVVRKAFGDRRVSPGTSIYATAILAEVFKRVVTEMESKRTAFKKPPARCDRIALMMAIRNNPELAHAFRGYTFATNQRVKYASDTLLTKSDREAAIEKRARSKEAKKAKAAVPAIDDE